MRKILFLVLLISTPGHAQTVSKDTLQFKGNFNLSGSLTSGTEFQRTFQFEFNPTFEKRSWSFENQFRFLFSDADDEVLNRNWDALSLLKLYLNGKKKWYPFFVSDLQTNLGYELEFRLGYGGGLTYKPISKNNNKLLFSVASLYYRNRYTESVFVNSDRIGNQRNMLRLVLHYDGSTQIFKDKLLLKSNAWFLQSTRESVDYIFKLYISLEFKLTKVFSLTTDYRFNYENVSLESLDNNQQFTSIGIRADFK
ncbi:MAG: DUF481 domain-containing protein [Bacteroidota bacterium]